MIATAPVAVAIALFSSPAACHMSDVKHRPGPTFRAQVTRVTVGMFAEASSSLRRPQRFRAAPSCCCRRRSMTRGTLLATRAMSRLRPECSGSLRTGAQWLLSVHAYCQAPRSAQSRFGIVKSTRGVPTAVVGVLAVSSRALASFGGLLFGGYRGDRKINDVPLRRSVHRFQGKISKLLRPPSRPVLMRLRPMGFG